jgi:hypothetical protein
MPTRIPLILFVALATALIAAGCGGDDDEPTTTAATEGTATGATGATGAADVSPERAELIEQADEICAEGDREIDAEAQDVFGNAQQEPPQAEQEAFVEDTVVPNIQDQIDQLRELDPPEEDADEFTAILDDAQAALDEVEADPSVLSRGSGGGDPFAEVNQRAQAFGLKACGS